MLEASSATSNVTRRTPVIQSPEIRWTRETRAVGIRIISMLIDISACNTFWKTFSIRKSEGEQTLTNKIWKSCNHQLSRSKNAAENIVGKKVSSKIQGSIQEKVTISASKKQITEWKGQ